MAFRLFKRNSGFGMCCSYLQLMNARKETARLSEENAILRTWLTQAAATTDQLLSTAADNSRHFRLDEPNDQNMPDQAPLPEVSKKQQVYLVPPADLQSYGFVIVV
jgi:hypothetical protein